MSPALPEAVVFKLGEFYLSQARDQKNEKKFEVALDLYNRAKDALRKAQDPKTLADETLRNCIADAYLERGEVLESLDSFYKAAASYRRARDWGHSQAESHLQNLVSRCPEIDHGSSVSYLFNKLKLRTSRSTSSLAASSSISSSADPPGIDTCAVMDTRRANFSFFVQNRHGELAESSIPSDSWRWDGEAQFDDARYLVAAWKQINKSNEERQPNQSGEVKDKLLCLRLLTRGIINEFAIKRDKTLGDVREVVALAELSDPDIFRALLGHFISAIYKEPLLQVQLLDGLAQILQQAEPGILNADDGVQILGVLDTWRKKLFYKEKAKNPSFKRIFPVNWRKNLVKPAGEMVITPHIEEADHVDNLLRALVALLDAMADANVKGLNREQLHTPLYEYLNDLSKDSNIRRAYQATYACQALLHVPNDEKLWQSVLRRSIKVAGGALALASAVRTCDPQKLVDTFEHFNEAFAGLGQFIKTAKEISEAGKTLYQGGKSAAESFREGVDFGLKKPWYTALRHTELLIQTQKLQSLNVFVSQVPVATRLDPNFLFGLSLQLEQLVRTLASEAVRQGALVVPNEATQQGELAWSDEVARQGVFSWLEDIYLDDERWGSSERVKRGVLSSLVRLTGDAQLEVSKAARMCLARIAQDKDPTRKIIYEAYTNSSLGESALPKSQVAEEGFPTELLNAVQNKPIEELKMCVNEQFNKLNEELTALTIRLTQTGLGNLDAQERLALWRRKQLEDEELKTVLAYVSPEGKDTLREDEEPFGELKDKVDAFLQNRDKKVLLLLGDSGAGKSTFNYCLAQGLWHAYEEKVEKAKQPEDADLPLMALFISLPLIKDPGYNLIHEYLSRQGFSKNQIQALQGNKKQPFVFILDGYDEISQRQNLYVTNKFSTEWPHAQVIISCRSEVLGKDYQATFQPRGQSGNPQPEAFQELIVAPFSEKKIYQYIEKYIDVEHLLGWSFDRYDKAIKEIPNFRELLSNPFILRLALEIIPLWEREDVSRLGQSITRLDLYDAFIREWFAHAKARLEDRRRLIETEQLVFQELGDNFAEYGIDFSQCLAVELYENPQHQGVMDYATLSSKRVWEAFFKAKGLRRKEVRLLLECSSLRRSGQEYRFLHKSIRDYFVARSIGDEIERYTGKNNTDNAEDIQFNKLNLIDKDPAVLQFLAERVKQRPAFKELLCVWIETSKTRKEKVQTAAANALTILVKAGVQFNGKNFNGIHVRGADLSYGVFDHAEFEGADLSKVIFRGVWLRGANLEKANLDGVNFGELPSLEMGGRVEVDGRVVKVGSRVRECCYSSDGRRLAVGTGDGNIRLYQAGTLELVRVLNGYSSMVNSMSFSPDGMVLASSGHSDNTVKLWRVEGGEELPPLEGHGGEVMSVNFSQKGKLLAAGNQDGTIKLWEVENREVLPIIEKHNDCVMSVSFSLDGQFLASGSADMTVKQWRVGGKEALYTLKGHNGVVASVNFSPNGKLLASGSWDHRVKLWKVASGEAWHTLEGHGSRVMSVSFSPNNKVLASGGEDNMVRLWRVESGEALYTLRGHSGRVMSVSFSPPNGEFLASGSYDQTVKLWRMGREEEWQMPKGHNNDVVRVVSFSPDGQLLVSGSKDGPVKLWKVESGEALYTLEGHDYWVGSVSFSPDGQFLASGGWGRTVKLWKVASGEAWHTLQEHSHFVTSMNFSQKGGLLAVGTQDGIVTLWQVESGEKLHTLKGHSARVMSVSFSPNGKVLASGSEDHMVKLWRVENGEELRTLKGHNGWVASVNFRPPDGKFLASGSWDHTVKLWRVESGEEYTLEGHSNWVVSVNFSPNGEFLASWDEDGIVKLWLVDTGECKATLSGFVGSIDSIAWQEFPKSGIKLVSRKSNAVHIWQVEQEENSWKFGLYWTSSQNELILTDTSIQDAQCLSPLNARLLKQRGAQGEPALVSGGHKPVLVASLPGNLIA